MKNARRNKILGIDVYRKHESKTIRSSCTLALSTGVNSTNQFFEAREISCRPLGVGEKLTAVVKRPVY